MPRAVCFGVLAAGIVIATGSALAGPVERGPMPHLVDLYGDPLPEGAIARLGSVRLRHPGLGDFTLLPDDKTAVTVSDDKTVRWWDLETGRQTRAVRLLFGSAPKEPMLNPRLAVSRDGTAVAFGTSGRLVVCDTRTGRVERTVDRPATAYGGGWDGLTFAPDGATVAYGTGGEVLTLLSRKSGEVREVKLAPELEGSAIGGMTIAFSADGRRVVVARGSRPDGDVRVLDVATLTEVFRHSKWTQAQALSPDGTRLAVCAFESAKHRPDAVLQLHDLRTGRAKTWKPPGIDRAGFSVTFAPDGKAVACRGRTAAELVDPDTGRAIRGLPDGDEDRFSASGRLLAVRDGQQLSVWDAATGRPVHHRRGPVSYLFTRAVTADGRTLAVPDSANRIGLWDLETGRLRRHLTAPQGSGAAGACVALSFDGRGGALTAVDNHGATHTWNVRTAAGGRCVPLRGTDEADTGFQHLSWLSAYRFSPDGRRAAAVISSERRNGPRRLAVWDAGTGEVLYRPRLPFTELPALVAWLPDRPALLVQGPDKTVVIDVKTGRIGPEFPGAHPRYSCSADGRLTSSCLSGFGDIPVWEVASGRPVVTVPAGRPFSFMVGIAPAARAVVIVHGRSLRVDDLVTGKERGRWAIPTDGFGFVADHPIAEMEVLQDGRRVLTTLHDGTALVWDLSSFPPPCLSDRHGEPELRTWWDELAGEDAVKAHAAGWKMSEAPSAEVVTFLRGRLRPVKDVDADEVRKRVADLDSPTFARRDVASRRLEQMGLGVLPYLRKRPAGLSAEAVERLTKLVERLANPVPPADTLRALRAIAVLERIGTPDGQELLAELASGVAAAPEAKAAHAALARMRLGWAR